MSGRWAAFVEREDQVIVPLMNEEDEGLILLFGSRTDARRYLEGVPLYQAFGGFVVDLDEAAE